MAQQVVCVDRDDVFACTPPLAVARTLLVLTSRKVQVHRLVRRQAPPRTAAQPDGYHGEQVHWMS